MEKQNSQHVISGYGHMRRQSMSKMQYEQLLVFFMQLCIQEDLLERVSPDLNLEGQVTAGQQRGMREPPQLHQDDRS